MIGRLLLVWILSIGFLQLAHAKEQASPIGTWITVSDKTHDRSGMVNIYERNGKLYGKVIKIFPGSGRNPAAICDQCPAPFKNKPVMNMVILWDFIPQQEGVWGNGHIMDTKTGDIYQSTLTLIEGGKQLQVRGYWGIFWRTQVWTRAH